MIYVDVSINDSLIRDIRSLKFSAYGIVYTYIKTSSYSLKCIVNVVIYPDTFRLNLSC